MLGPRPQMSKLRRICQGSLFFGNIHLSSNIYHPIESVFHFKTILIYLRDFTPRDQELREIEVRAIECHLYMYLLHYHVVQLYNLKIQLNIICNLDPYGEDLY